MLFLRSQTRCLDLDCRLNRRDSVFALHALAARRWFGFLGRCGSGLPCRLTHALSERVTHYLLKFIKLIEQPGYLIGGWCRAACLYPGDRIFQRVRRVAGGEELDQPGGTLQRVRCPVEFGDQIFLVVALLQRQAAAHELVEELFADDVE